MIGIPDPRFLLGGVVAVALAASGAYIKGRMDGRGLAEAEYASTALVAADKARETERKAAAITQDISTKHAQALQEIVIVRKIIEREVVRYVTPEADALFTVPVGFVWLHDAAASGSVPNLPDAAGSADAPSGIPLSAVAGTVGANYGACHETAARLTALQKWVRLQAENGSSSHHK